jgi:hypothetical protein
MINDEFLEGMATLASGGSYTVISHLAFGSTSGTITATDLITSGEFERDTIDSTTSTGNTVTYVGSRSSAVADGTTYINVVGWHNASTLASSGNLQANFLLPSLLQTTSFDLEFELTIDFNRVS